MGRGAGQYLQGGQGPAVGAHVHIPLEPGCYVGCRNGIPMGFSEFDKWGPICPFAFASDITWASPCRSPTHTPDEG